ncbi:hemerythrin domain-containing protein [Parafrankia discariae]|uniref:hemerythrin domain-containing protein n=1 Tax=Parafrankia discariae TaxID=365528 RepID=UPI000363B295|nr:SRPBCC family protein [Parafrankia discariae]
MASATAYLLIHEAIRVETRRLADFATELAAGRRHAGPAQLAALRAHLDEVVDVIHHHHVGEDMHLWPLLRRFAGPFERVDGLDLLDGLGSDHDLLDPPMERVRTALARLTAPGAAAEFATACATLLTLMDEHLTAEESVVVPILIERVPDDELVAMEKRMQRGSRIRLGFALPWLDAADPARMAEVAGQLGPVLPALLALTRRGYRRRVRAAYGVTVTSPGPVTLRGQAEIVIEATPEQVYEAVTDVVRMARHSPECYRCAWLDGAAEPLPGARFRGWNRFRGARWSRECEIVTAEPGVAFAYRTVRTATRPDSTLWRFELAPAAAGTRLRQTFELSGAPPVMVFERLSGRDTSTPKAMARTLARLRDDILSGSGAGSPAGLVVTTGPDSATRPVVTTGPVVTTRPDSAAGPDSAGASDVAGEPGPTRGPDAAREPGGHGRLGEDLVGARISGQGGRGE